MAAKQRAKSAPPSLKRASSPGLTPKRFRCKTPIAGDKLGEPEGEGSRASSREVAVESAPRSRGRPAQSPLGLGELRAEVGASCLVRWWEGEKRKSLTTEELLFLKARLDKFAEGSSQHKLDAQQTLYASCRAHAFWSSLDLTSDTVLPLAQQLGLKSACEAGGMKVTLWTYSETINNVPDIASDSDGSLTVLHAGYVYPREKAELLLRKGFKVQHIADLVRMSAAVTWMGEMELLAPGIDDRPRVARAEGAWAIDLDTIWFKPAKSVELQSRSGALFAMFPWSSRPKWVSDPIRYWKLHYCRKPDDMMRIAFPLHLTAKQKPLVNNIIEKMETVAKKPFYGQVMNWILEEANQQGFGHDITPDWRLFTPIPPYQGQDRLFKANAMKKEVHIQSIGGGVYIPAEEWIFDNSYAMSQYWCSTAEYNEKKQEMTKDGLQISVAVEQDSFYMAILQRMSLDSICRDGKLPLSLPQVCKITAEAAPTEEDVQTAKTQFPGAAISLSPAVRGQRAGGESPSTETDAPASDADQDAPAAGPCNAARDEPPAPRELTGGGRRALAALATYEKDQQSFGLFHDIRILAIVCKEVAAVFWEQLLWQWQVHNALHSTKGFLRGFGLSTPDVYELLAVSMRQWERVSRPHTGLAAPLYDTQRGAFRPAIGAYVDLALLLGGWALNAEHERERFQSVCDAIQLKHGPQFAQTAYEVHLVPFRSSFRLRPRTIV